jgi:hypothetical protein
MAETAADVEQKGGTVPDSDRINAINDTWQR